MDLMAWGYKQVAPNGAFDPLCLSAFNRAAESLCSAAVPRGNGLPFLNVEFERESDIFVRRMA